MDVKKEVEDPADFLPVSTVGSILNVSRSTAYLLVNSGQLPSFVFGGTTRVKRRDLEEFIDSSSTKKSDQL